MRILFLGGTRFLGPHFVGRALDAEHEVTLFNRGETAPDAFPDVEQLRGDRETGDLDALSSGDWDAVIDTSAYYPRAVREALAALGDRFEHYLLISSTSVYETFDPDGYDEDAELKSLNDPTVEEVNPHTYGGLKVLCEEASGRFGGRRTIIRPGLVAGPGDHTDRFTYWPVKIDRDDRVLAPGSPRDPIQYIDVRDLAEFVVSTVEESIEGVFNVVTPRQAYSIGDLLEYCRQASDSPAETTWVDAEFLHEHDVTPWNELPLWVPPESPIGGIPHALSERAVGAGLEFHDLESTVRDTLEWFKADRDDELRTGLPAERERELITAYK